MVLFDIVNRAVKIKNVHLDKWSREKATNRVKKKYKLAGNPIKDLDQFIFFILSGHPDAYHKILLVKVGTQEWLNKNPKYPFCLAGVSHIDITRYEILSSRAVGLKIADSRNGFKYMAELPENKFKELQKKLLKLKYIRKPISKETKHLIAETLQATAVDIMTNLGI